MDYEKKNWIPTQLVMALSALFLIALAPLVHADSCPAGTSQVGTREERINDTTVVVHPQCRRNPAPAALWMSGIDCAMADVYGQAENFGADGLKFAADLRTELRQFQQSVATSTLHAGSADTDVTSLNLSRQMATGKSAATNESQFIVQVLVVRHAQGRVTVDVQSYLSGTGSQKTDQRQNIMIFDAAGNLASDIDKQGVSSALAQVSDSVQRCLGKQAKN